MLVCVEDLVNSIYSQPGAYHDTGNVSSIGFRFIYLEHPTGLQSLMSNPTK